MNVRPLNNGAALEVDGLRLWEPLPDSTVEALENLWSESGLLVFRRQALSEDEIVAFSARFGEIEMVVRTDWQSPNRPEVIQISNMKDGQGRSIGGLGAGELDWHSDQSYMCNPATGSLLYMVEMPRAGGRTYWANLARAYAGLADDLKAEIQGKHAAFDYLKRQSTYDDEAPMSEELRRKTPVVAHPLVNRHPVSGVPASILTQRRPWAFTKCPGRPERSCFNVSMSTRLSRNMCTRTSGRSEIWSSGIMRLCCIAATRLTSTVTGCSNALRFGLRASGISFQMDS